MANRIQLTPDGLHSYVLPVASAFKMEVDYAQLVKIYGAPKDGRLTASSECIGAKKRPVFGNPDPAHINTSFVERQNLSMRMHMRRFTRLTNAHSKKLNNHRHAISLYFTFYN
jgi:hypothetical protein